MLDLGLGRSASLGGEGLLPGRVCGGASVGDVEAEGLADVHLGTNERGDELESALVLDAADGTHLGEDVLDRGKLGPKVLILLVDRADVGGKD